ncbi:hypothetical protein COCC4DRAFT_200597 [Bipolaris maydis ATCC 48331]|uniref:DUF3295 domain-containing protein n=2 Tax=Cochliobolus heterostrophus TaxID=5016 RepID=M2UFC7_COCH5|nr:uncharacterized protein COCC4DRAFT_200597 [Bipolaris maydis ATCC 48331]EMD86713.1 hypothetical protein COCHEDRAFT_1228177 [Bipolaris maydis C5]KAJ6203706.1 hypothetical protein PSV09DRAFT_1228177 [Bipolaris maydis]ENI03105.1 hypothetical protein COCC4DRAFT_200597 [Bipolaris maydis ATCC 48331]KAJ6267375.1 hypothetical protein PSV08DRAFT_228958 [Bipolaris maydis]KAJ6267670.1 hypothetical protein PSV08DRAFT_365154 [Bipolaris maydis]
MLSTTTTIGNSHEPGVVIHGFEPSHNLTSVTKSNSTLPLSGRLSSVCKTDDSKNCDIIAEQEKCLQHPMACASNTNRILFKNGSPYHFQRNTLEREGTIETDKNEIDESAIEGDSDPEIWEEFEGEEESGPLFQRVNSEPNFTSRKSLLTSALHQYGPTSALQNAASRSSPAIYRSCVRLPITPSTDSSPQENSGLTMKPTQASRSKPVIMPTYHFHRPMSPKTTRRNMLNSELTGSLRQNLLRERRQKNVTTIAVAKRQQNAANPPILYRTMTTGDLEGLQNKTNQPRTGSFKETNLTGHHDNFAFASCNYNSSGW